MLKHTLVAGIMSLGFIVSAPAMAHSVSGNYESITPVSNNHYHPPVRHCVSGRQINQRQVRQKNRIRNGVQNGKLVNWEAKQLKKQQRKIRKKEANMRADGCLTNREFNKLMSRLDQASKKIKNLKSNHIRVYHHRHDRPHRHYR